MERRLPVGMQNFKNIRQNDFVYVDMTAILMNIR